MSIGCLESFHILSSDLIVGFSVEDDILDILRILESLDECLEQVGFEVNGLGLGGLQGMEKTAISKGVVGGDYGHGLRHCSVSHGQPMCTDIVSLEF